MNTNEFFATCAFGLEHLLADELREMKIKRIRPLKGGVAFFGAFRDAYRVCLWSRVASRVLFVLARVDSTDADALYRGVRAIDWAAHLGSGSSLSVHAHGTNDALRNTQFSALKVKDAVCDRLRDERGSRPDVEIERPDVVIDVAIRKNKATVSLDFSGEPLHRRGYRKPGVQTGAPLKESLAAAILLESGWRDVADVGGMFFDPMCGSGTLVIEAAMIAADSAPGIMRDYWGFFGWAGFDSAIWDDLIAEADERLEKGCVDLPRIMGSDIDASAIAIARDNAKRSGLSDYVEFHVGDVADLGDILDCAEGSPSGLMSLNPPYGKRLSSHDRLSELYEALSEGVTSLPEGWHLSLITPDAAVDAFLGLKPKRTTSLYNGRIETTLRQYEVARDETMSMEVVSLDGNQVTVDVLEKNSDQFAARFRKVAKQRMKWARKNKVECYRLYDADLPDYVAAIDMYEEVTEESMDDDSRSFIHIAEYQPPAEIDPLRAQRRFRDILTLVPALLGVDESRVFSKTRRRDKGGRQYRDARGEARRFVTRESGHLFEVDLGSYLDTGIFLDHRITRSLVGDMAKGKRFLNLFAYTGTATVYAAASGAVQTTTVDLSRTYLDWARRNMTLNGFSGSQHEFVKADVLDWMYREQKSDRRYDVIFVDPPTFSNSKAMGEVTWSVQRDHVALLNGVCHLLAQGGKAVFSCNLRTFRPDLSALSERGIEMRDITSETIPEDFSRNRKVHKCYIVSRKEYA